MASQDSKYWTARKTIVRSLGVKKLMEDWESRKAFPIISVGGKTVVPDLPVHCLRLIFERARVQDVIIACLSGKDLFNYLVDHPLNIGDFNVDFIRGEISIRKPMNYYYWYDRKADVEEMIAILDFLTSIFQGNVRLFVDEMDINYLTNQRWLDWVNYLEYDNKSDDSACHPDTDTTRTFLNLFPNVDDLRVENGKSRWHGEKFFNVDHLTVTDADSMFTEDLVLMQNRTISIYQHNFSPKDINLFLRGWQEGKYPNLEMFTVEAYAYRRDVENWYEEYEADLLKDLDAKPFDCKRRHPIYCMPDRWPSSSIYLPQDHHQVFHWQRSDKIDMREAWDIERTVNGETSLASVLFTGNQLIMLVWYHPYPCLLHVPQLEKDLAALKKKMEDEETEEEKVFFDLSDLEKKSDLCEIYDREKELVELKSWIPLYEASCRSRPKFRSYVPCISRS